MLLELKPALKDYLWGGTRLKTDYKFKTDLEKVAEGWMLSCHKDGHSVVTNGKYQGKTLQEVIECEGKEILGTACERFDAFPILIKLIDAKKNLSVQVHPNDEYAMRVEGEYGKTECWYIVDCEEGAELLYGFKKEISSEEFKKSIEDGTLLDVVNHVKVKKGDFYFIEAGTLHAIGSGILLAEIQQNSNTTYRVFDYNRLGADGKPRPLHTKKAIDVTKCVPPTAEYIHGEKVEKDGYSEQLLAKCNLFSVTELEITKECNRIADETSFVSILVLDGTGSIECEGKIVALKPGDSLFISANSGKIKLSGKLNILETKVE